MSQIYSLTALPGRTALINGEEWLYFSGTAYLGIVQNEIFKNLVSEGIQRFGVHYGGSRLSNTQLPIFEEAELLLAKNAGVEAAVTVTSGTLAGRLVLQHFSGDHYVKCHAPGAHPAIQGTDLIFRDSWFDEVFSLDTEGKTLVILANHVDPIFAVKTDFRWIERLRRDQPVIIIVDDSHGFGIIGRNGGGICTTLELPPNVSLVAISSLGKALGIPGGVILGPKSIIDEMHKMPLFGGASPIAPAFLYAYTNAQELYAEQRQLLRKNLQYFLKHYSECIELGYLEGFPVFYTRQNTLAEYLQSFQIMISSFRYPTAQNDLVTRIVLNSLHTIDDIQKLIHHLGQFSG